MSWLNLLVEQVIISEGYSAVRKRITPLLQKLIPGLDRDRVKMTFSKHERVKDNKDLPPEFRNIDAYFANTHEGNVKDKYEALIAELDKIPDKPVTKQQSKNTLFKDRKIADDNEYVLFKVTSHDDAVNLVRPGKNNPYNWPVMLPVAWCIAADSEEGKKMWNKYIGCSDYGGYGYDDIHISSTTPEGIECEVGNNFYFAFRKHPLYDKEIGGKKVNPMDFIAIQAYADGHFEYTSAPNGGFGYSKCWPKTVNAKWQKKCKCVPCFIPYTELTQNQWVGILYNQPQFKDLAKQYNAFEKFDVCNWCGLLSKRPQFIDLAKQYNAFENFDRHTWSWLLGRYPQFINLAKQYNAFEKFNSGDWMWLLNDHPQLVGLVKQYNAFEKFNSGDWKWLLNDHPQFIDLAKQYGYKP